MPQPTQSILIHYSEIGLKGRNQPVFRQQLRQNISAALHSADIDWPVEAIRGHLFVTVPDGEKSRIAEVTTRISQVFGVAWLTPAALP